MSVRKMVDKRMQKVVDQIAKDDLDNIIDIFSYNPNTKYSKSVVKNKEGVLVIEYDIVK